MFSGSLKFLADEKHILNKCIERVVEFHSDFDEQNGIEGVLIGWIFALFVKMGLKKFEEILFCELFVVFLEESFLGSNEFFAFGEEELMQVVVKFIVLFEWQ